MQIAPLPLNEEARLKALQEYHVLDSASEAIYDVITSLAAKICDTPIALISLMDRERQWFKSVLGLPVKETSRDVAFCAHTILSQKMMEVADATKDVRFADNPLVQSDPNIRFYAGMPLTNPNGYNLGTLCVIDRKPKTLSPLQKDILENLSKIVIALFEAKKLVIRDFSVRQQNADALQKLNNELGDGLARLKHRNEEINLLGELSAGLQSCLNFEETYSALSDFGARLFPNTSGMLYLKQDTVDDFQAVAHWGKKISASALKQEDCWALRRGQWQQVDATHHNFICRHLEIAADAALCGLCLPLTAQGETLGLLNIVGKDSVEQQALALNFSQQIGLAMANIKLRQTLHGQSIHDPLTQIYNRRYLDDALLHALSHEQPIAIVMFDIDHFKNCNDQFGHPAGDYVLCKITEALKNNLRGEDLICRFGGEEFVIVMRNIQLKEALVRAESFRQIVQALKLEYEKISLGEITISLGVACYPNHGHNAQMLLQAVDEALYRAKNNGRNQVVAAKD